MTIQVYNQQSAVVFDLAWLKKCARFSLREVRRHHPLPEFPAIEVAIVSDQDIATVHEEFMGITGPTDVITFSHGEIVISADTANRYRKRYAQRLEHELALYIIHGLLHLCGFDDLQASDARRMRQRQQSILRAVIARSATTS